MTLPATVNPPTQDTSVDKQKVDDGPQPATTSKTTGTSSAMKVDDESKSSRHSHSMTVRTQFQDDVRSRVLKRHTARSRSPAQGPQVSNPPAFPAGAQVTQRTRASAQQSSRSPAQGTQVSNPPVSQTGAQVKSRAGNPTQPKMGGHTRTASQVSSSLSVNASPFVPQVHDQVISGDEDGAVGAHDGTPLTSPHHPQMSSTPRNVNRGGPSSSRPSSRPHVSFNPQPQVMQQSISQSEDRFLDVMDNMVLLAQNLSLPK